MNTANGRVAVIGSGISGLSAAWHLGQSREVVLFEKSSRIGGHTNTFTVETKEGQVPVDTGFIVYNEKNYPNLSAFFSHLDVKSNPTTMSFAVSVGHGRMEYSGRHLDGLFGQRRNILRVEHWQLVSDILRFFSQAEKQVEGLSEETTVGEFLLQFGYSRVFIEDHILPISAAIWSTPARGMLDFPAKAFIRFFSNHSLLQINDRPLWRTVDGGSRTYVDRLLDQDRFSTRTGVDIAQIVRHAEGAEIFLADGTREHFDAVVLACHADEALALLPDATAEERSILGAFKYSRNTAVLHTDSRFMPRRKRLWSSWNYLRSNPIPGHDPDLSVTYWMNRLQVLPTKTNLFVTLNPARQFAEGSVKYAIDYDHPLFDAPALAAQNQIWQIQGTQHTWFAGAWLGHGFHEDGLQSGLEVAERISGIKRPWIVPEHRGRIAHNWSDAEAMRWAAE